MNLVLLFESDFKAGQTSSVCLSGRRAKHIREIHKVVVGQKLGVGLLDGKMGDGVVVSTSPTTITLDVNLTFDPPQKRNAVLVLALPRPLVLKRTLLNAATLGMNEIHLIQTHRVEKSYWNSSIFKNDEINEQLILGLEQAKDTAMPKVYFYKKFNIFVKDILPMLLKGRVGFFAHPNEKSDFVKVPSKKGVVLVIGPEGGFIPKEAQQFKQAGFKSVNLGERILKTEAALPFFCGKVFNQ